MKLLAIDNAVTILKNGIGTTDTQLVVENGSVFPNPGTNEGFIVTIHRKNNPDIFEKVVCTSRNGNVLNIIRAYEAAASNTFSAGDYVKKNVNAGEINNKVSKDGDTINGDFAINGNFTLTGDPNIKGSIMTKKIPWTPVVSGDGQYGMSTQNLGSYYIDILPNLKYIECFIRIIDMSLISGTPKIALPFSYTNTAYTPLTGMVIAAGANTITGAKGQPETDVTPYIRFKKNYATSWMQTGDFAKDDYIIFRSLMLTN